MMSRTDVGKDTLSNLIDRVTTGDCVEVMRQIPDASVDLIATDPPFLVHYSPQGRSYPNDDPDKPDTLFAAMREAYRVLKRDRLCVCFYGWKRFSTFARAWEHAGFRAVGHMVWVKPHVSRTRFTAYRHEGAYVLAKGRPRLPERPPHDVQHWVHDGHDLHPAQKSAETWMPVIRSFSHPGDIVLDAFSGSGGVAKAAQRLNRRFIAIEIVPVFAEAARRRLKSGNCGGRSSGRFFRADRVYRAPSKSAALPTINSRRV